MTSPLHRPLLEFRNLRAGYLERGAFGLGHRRVVVDGVSLVLSGGDVVGVVGGNATGKSTFIRAIVDPVSRFDGEVLCDGAPLQSIDIAYVPQNPALTLSPWKDVAGELSIPLRIRGMTRNALREHVLSRAKELAIDLPMDRRVEDLSGGQRVRVAIYRALMPPEAKLLVLDEPFEGLDDQTRADLMSLIRAAAARGVAVIITSHRSEDLTALGARAMRLTRSNMIETGAEAAAGDGFNAARVERGASRLRRATASLSSGLLGLVIGALLWWLAASFIANAAILPGPASTFVAITSLLTSREELPHLAATLARAGTAWILASVAAIPLGIVMGANRGLFQFISPWLSWGRCVPVFALTGSAIGLFPGHPELQRSFLIWLTLFLICLQIVSMSAAVAPRRRMDLARIFGASVGYRLWRVLLPECAPGIVSALEVSLPTAIIVTLVVETTMLPEAGVGLYIFNHMTDRDLSMMFAYILLPGMVAAVGVWAIRSTAGALRHEL